MSKILVSIIIPCFNVEEYIGECLESALNQTYRPIEIIAVDNNSTDTTKIILKKHETKHPEIITVLEERVQGPSAARNKGMSIAKGQWMQFLDADDLLEPDKLAHQIQLLENSPEAILVVGSYLKKDLKGRYREFIQEKNGDSYKTIALPALGDTVANLFKNLSNETQPLWNINMIGPEDANFIFDYLIINERNIIFDRRPLTIKRERPTGQITKSNTLMFHQSCLSFQLRTIDYLKTNKGDYFLENKNYYLDNLYYFVYRLGLYDDELGYQKLKEILPNDYFPYFRNNNRITFVHFLGIKFFGFKVYVRCRKFFLEKMNK